jgi:hypothetical protein
MAFDDLKAELALLINQMENQTEDPHERYLQIREKLNEMYQRWHRFTVEMLEAGRLAGRVREAIESARKSATSAKPSCKRCCSGP